MEISKFETSLYKYYEKSKKKYNFVRISKERKKAGKFLIPFEKQEQFFKIYTKLLVNNPGLNMSLAQKSMEYSPFRVDIDLTGNKLNNDIIIKIASEISNIMKTLFGIKVIKSIKYPFIFIMKRKEPYINKDGVHYMTDIVVRKNVFNFLNNKLKKILFKTGGVFDKYSKHDKIIDESIVTGHWMIYGSAKYQTKPYLLDFVYDIIDDKITHTYKQPILKFMNEELPKILSIHRKEDEIIDIDIPCVKNTPFKKNILLHNNVVNDKINDEFIEVIWKILDGLNEERYINEPEWTQVGFCLKSASNGDPRIFKIWDKFSRKALKVSNKKYDYNAVVDRWNRGKIGFYDWSFLYNLLKKDNIKIYNEIKTRNIIKNVIEHVNQWDDTSISDVLKTLLKDNFVTDKSNSRGNQKYIFYEFKKHKWHFINGIPEKLQDIIRRDLSNLFIDSLKEMDGFKKQKHILRAVGKMRDNKKRRGIIEELSVSIYKENFSESLNKNENLFAFKNGVFELNTGKFRDGMPEDMISVSCNCDYIKNLDMDCKEIRDMTNYIKEVFADEGLYPFICKLLASFMKGSNHDQHCYIFYGNGGSGKTTFFDLVSKSFGEYFTWLKTSFFTGREPKAHEANEHMAKLIDKRICCAEETNKHEKFNIRILKNLSGGAPLQIRKNYGTEKTYKNSMTMNFLLNDLPKLTSIDRSITRRIIIIPCNSVFVVDKNEKNLNNFTFVKEIDINMNKKIKKWSKEGYFMTWLTKIYRNEYKGQLLKKYIPKIVKDATNEYINQNNYLGRYVNTSIIPQKDMFITLRELKVNFRSWLLDNGKKFYIALFDDLIKYLKYHKKQYFKDDKLFDHAFKLESE
jgi:P4 family phage/plasmid primase-like protien